MNDRTCLVVLEYYEDPSKVFITRIFEKFRSEPMMSADQQIFQTLQDLGSDIQFIVVDAPTSLPHCFNCQLKCPGFELCSEPEIEWLRNFKPKKKIKNSFTPYTQRCTELYLSQFLEEKFEVHHALGANLAPQTARMRFLKKRHPGILWQEAVPRVSVWRIGRSLGISKSHLRLYRQSSDGATSRRIIAQELQNHWGVFVYQSDLKLLIEHPWIFDSFILAVTGLLAHYGSVEKRPESFPKNEIWPLVPEITQTMPWSSRKSWQNK